MKKLYNPPILVGHRLYSFSLLNTDSDLLNGYVSRSNKKEKKLRHCTMGLSPFKTLRCCRNLSAMNVWFSKWFKSVRNRFLSISMAYNMISCRKVAENTEILKIAEFASSGRQNTVKKGPQPLFVQKACVPLFTFYGPPQYLSSFSSLRPKTRVKKSHFSRIFIATWKFFCRPAVDFILMPPTFHIASLKRYTPKFSGEVELVSIVCPPHPPKVRWCRFLATQNGRF